MRLLPRRRDVADGRTAGRSTLLGVANGVRRLRSVQRRRHPPAPTGHGGRTSAIDAAAARCHGRRTGKPPGAIELVEDQHPVGDLGPHCQDEPFGENSSPADTATESSDYLDTRVRQHRGSGPANSCMAARNCCSPRRPSAGRRRPSATGAARRRPSAHPSRSNLLARVARVACVFGWAQQHDRGHAGEHQDVAGRRARLAPPGPPRSCSSGSRRPGWHRRPRSSPDCPLFSVVLLTNSRPARPCAAAHIPQRRARRSARAPHRSPSPMPPIVSAGAGVSRAGAELPVIQLGRQVGSLACLAVRPQLPARCVVPSLLPDLAQFPGSALAPKGEELSRVATWPAHA